MNKLVALPALALAFVFFADPLAAAIKAPSSRAPAKYGGRWAWMPAGNQHSVHKTAVRDADVDSWETHALVTLDKSSVTADPDCGWASHTVPDLDKATLFIQTDPPATPSDPLNKPRLYIWAAGSTKPIVRDLDFGGQNGSNWTWMYSKLGGDWSYYVLFEDVDKNQGVGKPIEKRYRVEIYPPDSALGPNCKLPENALTATTAMTKSHPCQTGGGAGNEPNH